MGRSEESLKDLNKALEIKPNYTAALNNREVTYQKKESYEESFSSLNKSSEIGQNDRNICQMIESITDLCKSFETMGVLKRPNQLRK